MEGGTVVWTVSGGPKCLSGSRGKRHWAENDSSEEEVETLEKEPSSSSSESDGSTDDGWESFDWIKPHIDCGIPQYRGWSTTVLSSKPTWRPDPDDEDFFPQPKKRFPYDFEVVSTDTTSFPSPLGGHRLEIFAQGMEIFVMEMHNMVIKACGIDMSKYEHIGRRGDRWHRHWTKYPERPTPKKFKPVQMQEVSPHRKTKCVRR